MTITNDAQAIMAIGSLTGEYGCSLLPAGDIAQLRATLEYLSARLASTSPEPDGWVLAPREPTPEMLSAAAFATSGIYTGKWNDMAAAAYGAMIAAAPQPVVEKGHGE